MSSHFYAMLSRMKSICRWGLMYNTKNENLSEHSLETAYIAHALAVIKNRRFSGSLDVGNIALTAMFHDTSEIITGDMPTPIKYFNPDIKNSYKQIEALANKQLISMLPKDLQEDFIPLYNPDEETAKIIKAADKLSALIKCTQELNRGNTEFSSARESTLNALRDMKMPEVDTFINEFMDSFSLTLDEQRRINND